MVVTLFLMSVHSITSNSLGFKIGYAQLTRLKYLNQSKRKNVTDDLIA